jgi:hypothetical protein
VKPRPNPQPPRPAPRLKVTIRCECGADNEWCARSASCGTSEAAARAAVRRSAFAGSRCGAGEGCGVSASA